MARLRATFSGWACLTVVLASCGRGQPGVSKLEQRVAPSLSLASGNSDRRPGNETRSPSVQPSTLRPEHDEPPEPPAVGPAGKRWIVDEIADVAPAGPVTATQQGVLLLTREGETLLARLKPLSRLPRPGKTRVEPLEVEASSLLAGAPGPAVSGTTAYFVFDRSLVRRRFVPPGPIEILASEAREGTRVAAPPASAEGQQPPGMVAYLAPGNNRLVARLWVENGGIYDLSPEGTSPSSVVLVPNAGGWLALSLEGRSGMSPVHARTFWKRDDRIELGEDVVVWIGGAAQPRTELSALGARGGGAHAFVPLERDISRFGLVRIEVGSRPRMDAEVWWRNYPNGIEPAPVAAAWICGSPTVFYVRPADAAPHAPEELCLAELEERGLGPALVLARGRVMVEVSVAPLPSGALVAYVADRRTWALTLRCGIMR